MEIEILPEDLEGSYLSSRDCPVARAVRRKFYLHQNDVKVSGIRLHSKLQGKGTIDIPGKTYVFQGLDWSYLLYERFKRLDNFKRYVIPLIELEVLDGWN